MSTLAQMQLMARIKAKIAANKENPEVQVKAMALEAAKEAEAKIKADLEAIRLAQVKAAEEAARAAAGMINKLGVTIDMLNEKQRAAVEMEAQGISFCVTGAAGTGKTTIQRMIVRQSLEAGRIGKLEDTNQHKLLVPNGPSVLIVSYTNVATNNIKSTLPPELAAHCMTIHKALQYAPENVTTEVIDEHGNETGEEKNTMRFIPTYGAEPTTDGGSGLGLNNFLPHFDLVIVEEAGTVPVYLYKTLRSALPNPERTRWIFLGDIEQLEPAFGDGILGYMMIALPYVRLSEVYRNVGLVTKFAHRILTGREISDPELLGWNKEDDSGKLEFRQFKKVGTTPEQATATIGMYFEREAREGRFNPDNTMVLLPWNKHLGSIEIGRYIAQGFQMQDWKTVYEVRAGRSILHLCKGDRVFINKTYYEIVSIKPTKSYMGTKPRPASRLMDRWGRMISGAPDWVLALEKDWMQTYGTTGLESEDGELDYDLDILDMNEEQLKESRSKASHVLGCIKVNTLNNTDEVADMPKYYFSGVGDLNSMQFSYALTGHKAQGSEWENVYVVMHVSHSVTLKREWLYTACTRARRNLTVMYDGQKSAGSTRSCFKAAVVKQGIPGATLDQKLQHFRQKLGALYPSQGIERAIASLGQFGV